MITTNPFSILSETVPSLILQVFVLIMVGLVVIGTLIDIIHKKNVKYFFNNAKKAKKNATRELGAGERIAIIGKTIVHDIGTTAELGMGKRRIAHLKGSGKVSITKNRLLGFEEALHQNRVNTFSELIIESGFQEKGGYEAMKILLDLPTHKRPDAVFAVNDPVAFGAMEAINEAGLRIPEDMALVGFSDDIRSPLMSVPLTTIHQPAYDIGTKAASKLIRLIENDKELQEKELATTKE